MRTATIHTLDNRVHQVEIGEGRTLLAKSQSFEDLWGERLTMWDSSAIHREDGPAIEDGEIEQYWFAGIRYPNKEMWERRKNLKSQIDDEGNRRWSSLDDNALHRDDGGPALEYKGGHRWEWWEEGLLHRDGKPAVIDNDMGVVQYYQDGLLHNIEGPAVIYNDKDSEYYIEGVLLSRKEFFEKYGVKLIEELNGDKKWVALEGNTEILHREDGPAFISASGEKRWLQMGKLHRVDGPAIELPTGTTMWYSKGKLHRDDGPAVQHYNGDKEWFSHGKRHRTGAPAVEHANGTKEWWANGELFCTETASSTEYFDSAGSFHSPFPTIPAVIHSNGKKEWYKHGKVHREKGPAVTWPDGKREWYRDNQLHREDGPAVIYASGRRSWYLNGARITRREFEEFRKSKTNKERQKEDVKKDMELELARSDIFYLIYSATHRAYLANMKRTEGSHAYFGGYLKAKYADNKYVTPDEITKFMCWGAFAAEAGYDAVARENFEAQVKPFLTTSGFLAPSSNPYSVYRMAWAILNIDKNENVLVEDEAFDRAVQIAADTIGKPMLTYEEFLWKYSPAEARDNELEESGSWAGPALSILAAAAVGALTSKALKKKRKVIKQEKVQEEIVR